MIKTLVVNLDDKIDDKINDKQDNKLDDKLEVKLDEKLDVKIKPFFSCNGKCSYCIDKKCYDI